jgi:hypothetical protein
MNIKKMNATSGVIGTSRERTTTDSFIRKIKMLSILNELYCFCVLVLILHDMGQRFCYTGPITRTLRRRRRRRQTRRSEKLFPNSKSRIEVLRIMRIVAWRIVAWRIVAWRIVAWRIVAWRIVSSLDQPSQVLPQFLSSDDIEVE